MTEQNMALYAAASKHFVKSAGNASLHYVPDLNSADRLKPLCLVKRKKSFWLWKKPKIVPTMLTLNDVLQKPIDASKFTSTDTVISAYKDTPSFSIDGDIGAKIATQLDIDLSMTDKFSLNVDFGDISKTEVNWQQLEKCLSLVKIKSDHVLFKELQQQHRTSLCIVLESLACKAEGPLAEESDQTEKAKASAKIPKVTAVSVDVHMQGDAEQKSHHSYTIPAGTVIAFSCTKLDIDESGIMRMHIGVDKMDNSDAQEDLTSSSKDKFEQQVASELESLLKSKKFPGLKKAFMEVLQTPKSLNSLLGLISTASCLVSEQKSLSLSFDNISESMGEAKGWKLLLELLGFTIPESAAKGSEIEFPKEDPEKLIHAFWALIEAASDLQEQEIRALLKCDSNNAEVLLEILSNAIQGKDTPYSVVSKLMQTETSEKQFLKSMRFEVVTSSAGKGLSLKWNSHGAARDAYTMVYALLS